MKPALAFPLSDPDGAMFPHLQAILPDLKSHFEHAYVSPPLATQKQITNMERAIGLVYRASSFIASDLRTQKSLKLWKWANNEYTNK